VDLQVFSGKFVGSGLECVGCAGTGRRKAGHGSTDGTDPCECDGGVFRERRIWMAREFRVGSGYETVWCFFGPLNVIERY
jgi:hypothetical protein